MAEENKNRWGGERGKSPFKPKANAVPPPRIILPKMELSNALDFGPNNRAVSANAIRDAFNNSNPANYSTVDPFTTAPLLPTNAMPGIGYAQSPQGSINPSVDLNKLKPQFQDIVLPPIVPKPPSSVDPQVLLNQALQKRAQQAAMDVELRRQQQLEQGVGGKYGDGTYFPKNSSAVADYLNQAVPQSQLQGFRAPDAGSTGLVKVVPGIGHLTQVQQSNDPGYGNVMTGRYGTGSATFSDKPRTTGGTITENGKKVPIAGWFNDAARRQGESNQFFNKDGRKIVPDKKGESQKFS